MRVLILGDSHLLNTGFARVNKVAIKAFQKMGWEVAEVASLTQKTEGDESLWTMSYDRVRIYAPPRGDAVGLTIVRSTVEDFKPDVIYMTADLGTATMYSSVMPDMPFFIYCPIEGEPITNQDWQAVTMFAPMMTCSKYGVKVVKEQLGREIDFAYHGVDQGIFHPNEVAREKVRKAAQWENKFVVMCVANNVRRKQLPRLIEAVGRLKHVYKQKDIVLYLHTVPFQNYWLEGWNLGEIAALYGVGNEVQFNPAMTALHAGVPDSSEDEGVFGLNALYNAADVFVLPSQVEGFGLPIAEAMASGVPVIVTKYGAGWETASPAGIGIPPYDWETHKSGTRYANINPDAIAKEILRVKRNPNLARRMSDMGLERVKDFTWEPFERKLISGIQGAIEEHEKRNSSVETTDTPEEAPQGGVEHLQEHEGQEELREVSNLVEGQVEALDGQETQDEPLEA